MKFSYTTSQITTRNTSSTFETDWNARMKRKMNRPTIVAISSFRVATSFICLK